MVLLSDKISTMTETAIQAEGTYMPKEGQTQLLDNDNMVNCHSSSKDITSAEEFLLAEDVDTQEETEDESDEVNSDSCLAIVV